jgi:hypothetical protein
MTLEPNVPFTTSEPTIVIDAGLRPGTYRFQLIVIGRRGQRSQPIEFLVTITLNRVIPRVIPR